MAIVNRQSTIVNPRLARSVLEVPHSRIRELADIAMSMDGVLRLYFGESNLPTPRYIKKAAVQALQDGYTFYTENAGLPSLRQAIAEKYREIHRVNLDPMRHIVVTASGVQALNVSIRCLLDPGDEALILTPAWPNGSAIVGMCSARAIHIPHVLSGQRYEIDFTALQSAIGPRTRLILYTSPSNPLGWVATESDQKRLLELCRQHGLWLLADEVYERLYYRGPVAPSILRLSAPDDAVVVAHSFSKSYCMTGWRLGWLVSRPDLAQKATQLNEFIVSHAPSMAQRAAEAALKEGEDELRAMVGRLRENRDFVRSALQQMPGVTVPQAEGAFYLFPRIEGMSDSFEFCRRLLIEKKVGIAPGVAFGEGGEGSVRICYAADRAVLEPAMERINSFLASSRPGAESPKTRSASKTQKRKPRRKGVDMGIDLRSASPAVRSAGRAFLLSAILLALALSARTRALPVALQNPSTEEIPGLGFRITLGQGDDAPRDWSGEITLSGGRVSRLEGWHFALEDRIEGQTWKATSKKPVQSRLPNPANPPLVDPLGIFTVGIQAVIDAPGTTKVSIRTTPGDFSFLVKELVYGKPLSFLDGSVVVERQPVTQRVTAPELEDDDPAVAVTRDGTVWMAWIAYRNRSDEVLARSLKSGRWSDPVRVSPGGGDFFRVTLAEDIQGRIWFVWSAQENGNWDLQARSLDGGKWSDVTRLTQNPAPDTFHSLAASKNGNLALAWMSFREGQSDVYLKGWDGTRWSDEIKVSDSAANDWEPSVAVDSQGRSWVAWDSYERGSYNVLLRSVAAGQPGDLIRVTDSPRYHARAAITVDPADRVWVAWEESEANWGKDYGYLASPTPWQASGNPLYRSRAVRVAVLDNKVLKTPERDLMEAVPAWLRQYTQMPQLLSDPAGRIWVLLRVRSFVRTETADVWASGGRWNVFLTAYAGGSWLPVIPFPDSVARNYVRAAGAIAPDGKLWAAWPTDGRLFANPPKPLPAAANLKPNDLQGFGAVPQVYDVFTASVDPSAVQTATTTSKSELVLLRPDLASAGPVHPDEEASVRRIRSYEIRSGGKTYRIYRGDMHRHTDISADGAGDGSVMDLFRYAMDAARMDYAMVTDHNSGFDQEYSWWRIEKVDDLFHVPGHFTTLFGYERSLGYPNGHRNLAFAQRGVRTLPAAPGEQPQQGIVKVNSGSVLYPYLRQNRGIAFGHTSHTGMGTDWRDNDPDLEPLVEIYQGMRTSAEYEGAPKAPTQDRPATHQGGFQPAGFVWNAWAKGWKLGVQASSDHISTHISYSCLISEDGSREGLMNAMRRRHTYAATDNIILDIRMKDGSAEYLQGDIFVASGPAQLTVKVIGTQPLKEVRVVKNNRFVYDQKPGVREAEFSFSDADAQPGESYYYVRVLQEDGQVAWSSPIWVTRKSKK